MIGNRLKRTALASALSLAVFSASQPAHAVVEGDPHFHVWEASVYTLFVQQVTNQFFAINTYLSQIYMYLNAGTGETGTGLIGTMKKIAKQDQEFTESANKNLAQMGRVTATDAVIAQRVANGMPDPRECSEIPKVMGARMAGGGGGGSRSGKGVIERVMATSAGGTSPNAVAQAGDIYTTHASKYCAPGDVKLSNGSAHSAFGCSAASTTMPAGDTRVQSIFVPAHDFNDAGKVKAANLTFKPEEAQAATDASKTLLASFSPVALSADMESTPAGKQYLAKVNVFNARMSPAIHALAQIAALRMADNLSDAVLTSWRSTAPGVYGRVFPGMDVPQAPSEAEVMRFEVLRRYADSGPDSWHAKLIQDQDQPNLIREVATATAVNTYVNWQIHNRLEENNALQTAILAQLVNPVTKQEMDTSMRAVYATKK